MLYEFNCPVCSCSAWQRVEEFVYSKHDHTDNHVTPKNVIEKLVTLVRLLAIRKPRVNIIHEKRLTNYHKKRREILFNVWFTNKNEITLNSVFCDNCGFMSFVPRPNEDDLKKKYKYKFNNNGTIGGQNGYSEYAKMLDRRRAKNIYNSVCHNKTTRKLRVLDYGGGTGKLMQPFLDNDHAVYIVDYNLHPIADVVRLGDDINSLDGVEPFDVIICSHVLEHIANPQKLLKDLIPFVKVEGIVFAEVPLEIWAGIPIEADPVTHINFYTPNSFNALFFLNGFSIVKTKREYSNYGASFGEVLSVVARKKDNNVPLPEVKNDIAEFLYPARRYGFNKILQTKLLPALKRLNYMITAKETLG